MSNVAVCTPEPVRAACAADSPSSSGGKAFWLMLVGAVGIPLSLIWDYSWECTIGVDQVWAPAHVATYLAVALMGISAPFVIARGDEGVKLGRWSAPLGAWVI